MFSEIKVYGMEFQIRKIWVLLILGSLLDVEILNRLIDGYLFTNYKQWSIEGTSCIYLPNFGQKLAPAEHF